jgi:hypothetical protein
MGDISKLITQPLDWFGIPNGALRVFYDDINLGYLTPKETYIADDKEVLLKHFESRINEIENPRKKTIGFKPYGSYLCHVSGEVITNEGQRRQIMKKHGLQDKPECPAAIKNRETERFDRMMYERNRYAN